MDADIFIRMVNATKVAMAAAIDEVTDAEPEESGKLATFIVAELVAQWLACGDTPFPRVVNGRLECEPSPWRLVRIS
jgi:hypothetical protein